MKTYTVNQFKNYLSKQNSFGDAVYFCTEENIDKANSIENPEEWAKENYNLEVGDILGGAINADYLGKKLTGILPADNKGHFRTNYPVVFTVEEIVGKLTLEELFGY